MPPILNAQSLSKRFGAKVLFQDLNFVVADNDRIGLIGPNGTGKSTLLAVLAGNEDTDSGEVAVRRRARVAHVVQDSQFPKGSTVRGVLEAAPRYQQRAARRARRPYPQHAGPYRLSRCRCRGRVPLRRLAQNASPSPKPSSPPPDVPAARRTPPTTSTSPASSGSKSSSPKANPPPSSSPHDRYFLEEATTSTVELNRMYALGSLRIEGPYSQFLEERELHLAAQQKAPRQPQKPGQDRNRGGSAEVPRPAPPSPNPASTAHTK